MTAVVALKELLKDVKEANSMLENNPHPPNLVILHSEVSPTTKLRPSIANNVIEQMTRTLSHLSDSPWESDIWRVTIPTSGKIANIHFPVVGDPEAVLLRALALGYLLQYASPESAQRTVREADLFLQFLNKSGVFIEDVRSSIVRSYIDRLEHMSIGDAQRNSRIRAAGALFEVCVDNGLVTSGPKVVDFTYRFSEPRVKKRAPDQCVIDALDRLILDLANAEVSLVMRLVYFTVRLIPNRISEVLAMSADCLSYPDLGIYAVQIPTSKETSLHIPVYHDYNFSMAGELEQAYYHLIRMQQEALLRCGGSDVEDSDYLFYDAALGRVVSDSDFNQYIAGLISKHKIRNSDGSYPKVTSHMFRHVTIGERLRSDSYTPEDTMREANHSSLEMTLSYGYMSERDESKHLGDIADEVMAEEMGVSDHAPSCQAREVNSMKYARLQATPYTRVIPGMGLCPNSHCHPQYADCSVCSHFTVDPVFLDYFNASREIIQKRLDRFLKEAKSEKAIEFEQEQLEIVDAYIGRIEGISKEKQSERRCMYATG